LQKEETEAEEKEPLLLPEPEDPFRLPSLDDEDEEDVFEDFEPEPVQIPEKVREAMRNRGSSGEVAVKKMAQEMQRATSRWPGPQAVPRYVSRKEIVKQEKAEKAKAKSKGKA
jgi:hypothetical protein